VTLRVVRPGPEREVPRGVVEGAEVSAETVGAGNLFMAVFRLEPGARSRPHYHEHCESGCYMVSGRMRIRWGERLEEEVVLEPRDLLYVPPARPTSSRTSPTTSPPSTSSRATRRPRTPSRCPGPTNGRRASTYRP
jgi:uncharacterized RmlC-like cupin family protein